MKSEATLSGPETLVSDARPEGAAPFEESMEAFYAECVRSWLDEHPPSPESADDAPAVSAYDRWKQLIDVEYAWLIIQGRMPPHETGLYALEARRLGIHPTYEIAAAATLLNVPVEVLQTAVRDGDLPAIPAYGMVFVGVSAMYDYASAHGLSVDLPAGGDWLAVSDDERHRLRSVHEDEVLTTVLARHRSIAVEQLALDAARAEVYLAAHGS